jgi:hypothetical protein
MTALLVAAGLLLGAVPANPNPYLAQARVLYQGLDYEKALLKLQRAQESPTLPDAERAEILVYVGLCRHQLGDEAAARASFRAALQVDPKVQLPPLTSPKIAAAFDEEVATWEKAHAAPPKVEAPKPEERPKGVEAPEPAALPRPEPSGGHAEEGKPGKLLWPSLVAAGVAAVLVGSAAYFGQAANDRADAARKATFASDTATLSKEAQDKARTANVLYGTAGGIAALGVVFIIVF